ncbi:hypothetical protein [Polyangium sorediatum]|uniref:Uncharacterized protein n=1 Tax=Polyangium sorediatum TaxID=889274 RepID=A0ABT6NMR1_9BACT|nr:hypothetical protein [Polyangium sorediatum]MDI1429615.1 hypothetical protein [Polyangium sorediatum]
MKLHVNFVHTPDGTSKAEKELVIALAGTRADYDLANAYLERYREAQRRGIVPTPADVSVDVIAVLRRAEAYVGEEAPGFTVALSWEPESSDLG